MVLTIQEILNMKDVLQKLLGVDLPAKIAFKLGRLATKLQEELKTFEDTRMSLLKKYGEENKEKNTISIEAEEDRKKFISEIQGVLEEEIDIDFKPFTIAEFGDDLKISATDIVILDKIIKEE